LKKGNYIVASTFFIGLALAFWAGVQTGKLDSVGAGLSGETSGGISLSDRSAPSRSINRLSPRRTSGFRTDSSDVVMNEVEAERRGANLTTRMESILSDPDRVNRDQTFIGFLADLETADLAALAESIRPEGQDNTLLGGDK
jgi:hypothetical protein